MKKLLYFGAISLSLGGCTLHSKEAASTAPGQNVAALVTCDPSKLKLDPQALGFLSLSLGSNTASFLELAHGKADVLVNDRDAKGRIIHYSNQAEDAANGAEGKTGKPWAHKDLETDQLPGTSTERAYAELGLTPGTQVLVAVIDSGMDITHEDLKDNIWVNDKPSDAQVGDVHGWNFLGAKDGTSVDWTNLEVTRELRRMRELKAKTESEGGALSNEDASYLAEVEKEYSDAVKTETDGLELRKKQKGELEVAIDTLKKACQISGDVLAEVRAIESSDASIQAAKKAALSYLEIGHDFAWFKRSIESRENSLKYYYNLENDPGRIVGDDPSNLEEVGYGNGNVMPVNAAEAHATHVAGIIGAIRGNGLGIDGQVANVKIMSLRAVPNGDERDKDVANAIFYAVDHGARVLNMSFGKALSPQKEYVWRALGYAESKGVLVVHAAGNDSADNDTAKHFPDRRVRDASGQVTKEFNNVIEVGASTRYADARLPATFSDYGKTSVDLFGPGAAILSTVPDGKYDEFDGTSMATPEVAGIAALILTQRPDLQAKDLRELLMKTAHRFEALQVNLPGSDPNNPTLRPFTELSIRGGVVNTLEALKLALGK